MIEIGPNLEALLKIVVEGAVMIAFIIWFFK